MFNMFCNKYKREIAVLKVAMADLKTKNVILRETNEVNVITKNEYLEEINFLKDQLEESSVKYSLLTGPKKEVADVKKEIEATVDAFIDQKEEEAADLVAAKELEEKVVITKHINATHVKRKTKTRAEGRKVKVFVTPEILDVMKFMWKREKTRREIAKEVNLSDSASNREIAILIASGELKDKPRKG